MSASYFLGPRLVAVSSQSPLWDDHREAGVSQAFLCPTCGEVWARIVVPNTRWMAVHAGCRKHPQHQDDVGGTFIRPWRHDLRDLPAEILAYELDIRLALYKE